MGIKWVGFVCVFQCVGGQNPDTGCIVMPSANRECQAQLFCLIICMSQTMYVGQLCRYVNTFQQTATNVLNFVEEKTFTLPLHLL